MDRVSARAMCRFECCRLPDRRSVVYLTTVVDVRRLADLRFMTDTSVNDLRAALGMLELSRGVPIHTECLVNIAARWMRFEDQIQMRQSALEAGHTSYLKESLAEDIGNACAAAGTLLRVGAYGSDEPPLVGIAYKDSANWFEESRAAFVAEPPEDIDDLMSVAHVTYQHGVERLYELSETTIVIPELSDIGIVPSYMTGPCEPFHLDPEIAARRLREILTERMGLPEVPNSALRQRRAPLELPPGSGLC
jgi:hypothetical protein